MTDLQGAVGAVQIQRLDEFINERARWADFYRKELSSLGWLKLPEFSQDYQHGWQSFVTLIDEAQAPLKRNDLMEFLQQRGVSTRPGTHAVHMLKYYRDNMGTQPDDFPGARDADQLSMAIPLHNRMVGEDFSYIVATLRSL